MTRKKRASKRLLGPNSWASFLPFGVGSTKPKHYLEMAEVAWENRDQLGFAWRILNDGVCDGCALGTTGMRDWTMDEVHLCMVRLRLLRLNTMPALDHRVLENPARLRDTQPRDLRALGRLPYPMVWRNGEQGYRRVSWGEALDLAAEKIRRSTPERLSLYLTSRGLANETYFAFQKTARFLGTNNVDNSARVCHAPSTSGLKKAIGYGATTISYTDWIGTDVIVLVGTNMASNQPVTMKYLYMAKKAGTKVIVVNPYREEGLERYWVPSSAESALFGTKMMDEFFQVSQGGDAGFFNGALKHFVENDRLDHDFIRKHTVGFDAVKRYVESLSWRDIESASGLPEREIRRFAGLYADADTSVTVWSMGITQHAFGQQNVLSIANLALALGRIGREKCGLNPIRGHSGVQGGAEMGAVPTTYGMGRPVGDPKTMAAMKELWGFDVPVTPGLSATAAIAAMHDGTIDVLYAAGGDFMQTLPDPPYVRAALDRTPVKIFQDIVINPMMLLEPADVSIIFPAATRYETPGGVTETSTERRVIFSPEIPGRRIGEAKPEWEIPMLVAERVKPDDKQLIHYDGTAVIRADVSRVVSQYGPIKDLREKGDQFQWGGERLCDGNRFNTADGRAHFEVAEIPRQDVPEGKFLVATRRGKQFNSIVWKDQDTLTGSRRDQVFMSREDAGRLGLADGDAVLLRNDVGEFRGRVKIKPIARGNLQVHWPEGNVLVQEGVVDPSCGEPDYNAICEVVPLDGA
jgi:molybdopterin-dependent oxidoreductase alpha subunit